LKTSSVDTLIINIFNRGNEHYSSQEIFEELRTNLPAINRSTVYRSLERLVNNGSISVSDLGTGSLMYELVGEVSHHHLLCQNCKNIITISSDDVCDFFHIVEEKSRFKIITNHLILYGICENCAELEKTKQ